MDWECSTIEGLIHAAANEDNSRNNLDDIIKSFTEKYGKLNLFHLTITPNLCSCPIHYFRCFC